MPIYEYRCHSEECGAEAEVLHKTMPVRGWIICEECGGRMMRVLSPSNFKVEGYNADNLYSSKKAVKKDGKKQNKDS